MTDRRRPSTAPAQVGRSRAAASTRARSCAARRSSRATCVVPRMLHGKVLRSPFAHARIVSIDASAAEAMPGVVCVLTGARPRGHRPLLGPRDQGPADRRHRPRALPRRAGRGRRRRDRGGGGGGAGRDPRRVRGAAGRRHARGGARRRTRRSSTTGRPGPGSSTASASCPSATGTSATATASTAARSRPSSRTRSIVVEGEYTFPAVYQYAMETHTVRRPGRGRRDHGLGVVPAPVPRARRARRPVPACRWRERADRRAVPRRRLRLEVVHEDGAAHGRARAQGRAAGADPEPRRRVDGDDPPARHALPHAHGGERRGPAARAARSSAGSTPARTPTTARASRRPAATRRRARTAGRPSGSTPTASTRTRRPSGSYRAFGATHLQWIGEQQVDELARRAGLDPLEVRRQNLLHARRGDPRTGGKPLDADLVGDVEKVAAAVGWDEPKRPRRRARRLGRPPRRRRASRSRAPSCASRPTGASSSSSARRRWGRAPRTVFAQIAAEELGVAAGQRHGARRRHPLHALRPLDRREPLDDARRSRRPARRRRTSGRSSIDDRRASDDRARPTTSRSCAATSGSPAAS